MHKLILLNCASGTVSVVSVENELYEQYDNDIETLLESEYSHYNTATSWMECDVDEFGNIEVDHFYLK